MPNDIKIKFLEKSLEINHALRNAFDYKANFLLAISGIIFTLSSRPDLSFLRFFSALSAILCILAIVLPARKISKDSGLLCWWGLKNKTFETYQKEVGEIDSEERLISEYQKEIYSLYENSINYKSILLKMSGILLLLAFVYYLFV